MWRAKTWVICVQYTLLTLVEKTKGGFHSFWFVYNWNVHSWTLWPNLSCLICLLLPHIFHNTSASCIQNSVLSTNTHSIMHRSTHLKVHTYIHTYKSELLWFKASAVCPVTGQEDQFFFFFKDVSHTDVYCEFMYIKRKSTCVNAGFSRF